MMLHRIEGNCGSYVRCPGLGPLDRNGPLCVEYQVSNSSSGTQTLGIDRLRGFRGSCRNPVGRVMRVV